MYITWWKFALHFFQEWDDLTLGMNFTQDDVDMNHVRYVHTGSYIKSSTDFFVFQVNDGEHRMPKETFEIEIISSKGKEIALLSKGLAVKEGDSKYVPNFNIVCDILISTHEN